MRLRLGRVVAGSLGAGAASLLGYSLVQSEGDLNNIGAVRFGRAAVAVGKIALDYKATLVKGGAALPDPVLYEQQKSDCHLRSAHNLLRLCQINGGVFIKVGQHIGALDYLLPEEYVNTMKVLHSRSPEMALSDIYSVVQQELGQEPLEVFATFDPNPLGTASLAQVHLATLHSGQKVAVKVQHKYVKKHSFVDIWTCDLLVRLVKFAFPQFEFMWLANEMKINLPQELAFTKEAINAEKASRIFKEFDWIKVPVISWDLTTDRVLVMEFCSGCHINDLPGLHRQGVDPYEVSSKLGQMYSKMIFDEGYVHCDPHPGNLLVNKDKSGRTQIVLLDHGLYTQLTNQFRYQYSDFWRAVINRDVPAIRLSADKLGVGNLAELFACMVTARSWSSVQRGLDVAPRTKAEGEEIKANLIKYFNEIAAVLAGVNRQMILIFKTNDLLRGIESQLGTRNSMSSLMEMTRACYRVQQEQRLLAATSTLARWRVNISAKWQQFRISVYQLFLYLYWSRAGSLLRLRS